MTVCGVREYTQVTVCDVREYREVTVCGVREYREETVLVWCEGVWRTDRVSVV